MINKIIFTISLFLILVIENLINSLGVDVLLVEVFIINFFFINRSYLKKLVKHVTEKIILNYYSITIIIFLLIKSYFSIGNYIIVFTLILLFIIIILSDYIEEKITLVFISLLILFLVSIYILQVISSGFIINNYTVNFNFKTISYIAINSFLSLLAFLFFNRVTNGRLIIEQE